MSPESFDRIALEYASEDAGHNEAEHECFDIEEEPPELNDGKDSVEEENSIPSISVRDFVMNVALQWPKFHTWRPYCKLAQWCT